MKFRATIFGILLVLTATALMAHDLFIKLDSYFVEPDSTVTIPILNGTFEHSENSITYDRLLDVSIAAGGKRHNPTTDSWSAGEGKNTTHLTVTTGSAGTYVIGVSTRHRDFALSAADFNEYLEHDGIPDVLEARSRDGELEKDVRERYGKHVKAVVQVGHERSDDYKVHLGYPAEIVPLVNPYAMSVGEEIVAQCLVDGRPVSGQLVIVGGESADGVVAERSGRTDESGKIGFAIDRPGRWYIKFINMVKPESSPDVDYESKWATLTFSVR
jgi:hypothetical protein